MTKLSPAAQAVVDAIGVQSITALDEVSRNIAAAALRAVVKARAFEDFNTRLLTAADILAIATELENHQ
jgi:hypothetical protein